MAEPRPVPQEKGWCLICLAEQLHYVFILDIFRVMIQGFIEIRHSRKYLAQNYKHSNLEGTSNPGPRRDGAGPLRCAIRVQGRPFHSGRPERSEVSLRRPWTVEMYSWLSLWTWWTLSTAVLFRRLWRHWSYMKCPITSRGCWRRTPAKERSSGRERRSTVSASRLLRSFTGLHLGTDPVERWLRLVAGTLTARVESHLLRRWHFTNSPSEKIRRCSRPSRGRRLVNSRPHCDAGLEGLWILLFHGPRRGPPRGAPIVVQGLEVLVQT